MGCVVVSRSGCSDPASHPCGGALADPHGVFALCSCGVSFSPHFRRGGRHGLFPSPYAGTTNLPWAVMSLRGRGALTPPLIHVVALRPILMGFIRVVALWPILMGNFRRGWKAWPFSNPCRDDKFAMGCYVVSRSGSLTPPLIRVVALWPILMGWAIRPSHSYQTVQRLYCLLVPGIEPGRYGNYRAHRAGC